MYILILGEYKIGITLQGIEYKTLEDEYQERIEKLSPQEKENIMINSLNYIFEEMKFTNMQMIYTYFYDTKQTTKLCTTLEELANELGNETENDLIYAVYVGSGNDELDFSISGTITNPLGESEKITLGYNMERNEEKSTAQYYEYPINENGTYNFTFKSDDGNTKSINVEVSTDNPVIISERAFTSGEYRIMSGIDNFLDFSYGEFSPYGRTEIIDITKNISKQDGITQINLWKNLEEYEDDKGIVKGTLILDFSGEKLKLNTIKIPAE